MKDWFYWKLRYLDYLIGKYVFNLNGIVFHKYGPTFIVKAPASELQKKFGLTGNYETDVPRYFTRFF